MGRPASIQEHNITTPQPKAQDRVIPGLSEELTRKCMPFPTSHITENAIHTTELLLLTSEVVDQL